MQAKISLRHSCITDVIFPHYKIKTHENKGENRPKSFRILSVIFTRFLVGHALK